MNSQFESKFAALTGNVPFPWQKALYESFLNGEVPSTCDIPTGLGKTSVIAIWLLARAAGASLPRRLVYIVNRRTVVDQTSMEVALLRANRNKAGIEEDIAVSTLRGQMADNRAWAADPSQLAVICGTVDMIGSRLLFCGYRIGFKSRPLHAGFLGQDALLVHDEAHLEPAFQHLLERIEGEQQRAGDLWPMRVMALTATSRSKAASFGLGPEDAAHPLVRQRVRAAKRLSLHVHSDKDLVERVVEQALTYQASNRAVLLFLRSVDDVTEAVARLRRTGANVQLLTGTMRGLERDSLVSNNPVVRRFLPGGSSGEVDDVQTVYLVCTSAGEVGVNLSADHLVCDLSTFDSMAQRFGRVNRFGVRDDTEVHVFCPEREALDVEEEVDVRRLLTLDLLQALKGDASPAALGALDPTARNAAFAPEPIIVDATDILFDAWAMTTIREAMPGRPPVVDYLHGVATWEPPCTHVAWRDEVDLVTSDLLERYPAQELLEDYPLKPHELLTDRTSRVLDTLTKLASQHSSPELVPIWIVDQDGRTDVTSTLGDITGGDRQATVQRLADCTLLLPPSHCSPVDGLLTREGGSSNSRDSSDVADMWSGEDDHPLRMRTFDERPPPLGMRLVRRIRIGDADDADGDDERRESTWSWYEVPRMADTDGSRTAAKPVLLEVHSSDVEREAERIVSRLPLAPGLKRAVVIAAKLHDIGKVRQLWQRSIGNFDPSRTLAKSGGSMRPLDVTAYRHELGSVIDADDQGLLAELEPDERELALHLIAAHHGRARPHFPVDELFDPEARQADLSDLAHAIANRFVALQRRFGRWGLAYLESLVRAADYAASAQPSAVIEVPR
jgi:CRISPR-associated endonuclease/helicase Cas3